MDERKKRMILLEMSKSSARNSLLVSRNKSNPESVSSNFHHLNRRKAVYETQNEGRRGLFGKLNVKAMRVILLAAIVVIAFFVAMRFMHIM